MRLLVRKGKVLLKRNDTTIFIWLLLQNLHLVFFFTQYICLTFFSYREPTERKISYLTESKFKVEYSFEEFHYLFRRKNGKCQYTCCPDVSFIFLQNFSTRFVFMIAAINEKFWWKTFLMSAGFWDTMKPLSVLMTPLVPREPWQKIMVSQFMLAFICV